MHNIDLFIGVVFLCFVVLMLIEYGFIGTKRFRRSMRNRVRWEWKDAALFFPIDPDTSLPSALKEGFRQFWPTKKRYRALNRPWPLPWILVYLVPVVLVFALIALFVLH
jgi:hypothetical protein